MSGKYGKFWIYALSDPMSDQVFYVGRSKHPQTRLLQHLSEAEQYKNSRSFSFEELAGIKSHDNRDVSNRRKLRKINQLADMGMYPTFTILDEWEVDDVVDANRLEDAWIAHMKSKGEPLTNKMLTHRMYPKWYKTSPENYIGWLKSDARKEKMKEEESPYSAKREVQKYRKNKSKINRKRRRQRTRSTKWG